MSTSFPWHAATAALSLLLAGAAGAQPQPPAPTQARGPTHRHQHGAPARAADPLDAGAAAPAAVHRSALAGYRAAGDTPVGSWQQANERVNRVGGWRTYAREANAPEPAPAASAPAGAPTPAPPAAAPAPATPPSARPGGHRH
jgi:hypothetical protein